MSFKHKFISAITLALAIGTFSTFVAAQDSTTNNQTDSTKKEGKFERRAAGMRGDKGMRGGKRGGDRMLMGALYRLNLTDAQRNKSKLSGATNQSKTTRRMRGLRQRNTTARLPNRTSQTEGNQNSIESKCPKNSYCSFSGFNRRAAHAARTNETGKGRTTRRTQGNEKRRSNTK